MHFEDEVSTGSGSDRVSKAMANDEESEAEALEWVEATIGDVADEPR